MVRFILKTILLSLVLNFFFFSCFSQKWEPSFFNYSKIIGLPSNLVYGSLFDNDSLLWLCTDAGVVQFDGASSKCFTLKDGLPSNDVYHMFCDSKNRIWFTTLNHQISYYSNGKIHNSNNDSILKKYNTKSTFPTYFENQKGDIYILSSPLRLFKFSDSDLVPIKNIIDRRMIHYKGINCDTSLLFISDSTTYNFDWNSGNFSRCNNFGSGPVFDFYFSNNKLFGIHNDLSVGEIEKEKILKGKYFYKGAKNTLFCVDSSFYIRKKYGFEIINNNNRNLILSNYSCSHLNYSQSNSIWISTFHNGILCISNPKAKALNSEIPQSANLFSIISYHKNIYLGTENGMVLELSKNDKKLKYIDVSSRLPFQSRITKFIGYKDKLFISDYDSIFSYANNILTPLSALNIASIKNFYIENDSMLVLNNHGVLINTAENQHHSFTNFKRAYSYVNYKNQKLVGTQDSLMIIDKSYHPYFLKNPFSKRIMDLQTNGDLLFALTAENGLYIIRDHQVIKNINHETGLSSNNCGRSFLYKNELFISTDNGISVVDVNTFNTTFVFESDGLASNMVNDLLIENDTLYAATEEGLSIIPVSSIIRNKEFNLFAKPYAVKKDTVWDKPQEIVARTNQDITLVLNGTSYIKNTKKIYYYRIAELDSTFVSTLEKNILLNFHQTGHFHLEAYCVNAEGTKSKFLVIPIYIKPYFYQTIWFYLLLLALLVALIYFISRYYARLAKEKEQQKAAEEKRIRGLEIAAWRAGVNPHFLFNSLNGLQAFFRRNEFDKGNIYLSNFTQMLRNTVDTSNDLTLTVEEEIEYLREFLQFEQKKRDEKFEFFITYDTVQTLDYFIPSMVVQPVLENSLKHALSATKENIFTVNFRVEGERLVCVIADNGPGIRKTNREVRKSVGIALIRYKLRIIQKIINDPIEFFMKNRMDANHKPAGLETTFIFPLLTKRLKIDNEVDAENESKLIFEDSEENPNPPPPEEDSI